MLIWEFVEAKFICPLYYCTCTVDRVVVGGGCPHRNSRVARSGRLWHARRPLSTFQPTQRTRATWSTRGYVERGYSYQRWYAWGMVQPCAADLAKGGTKRTALYSPGTDP